MRRAFLKRRNTFTSCCNFRHDRSWPSTQISSRFTGWGVCGGLFGVLGVVAGVSLNGLALAGGDRGNAGMNGRVRPIG